ncbi:MAG TPA: hypothetical protein VN736_21355, partial [Candidatus Limnocylindrales bacterium]|nr:hypothetical protein [Candidatus Limnocylindrales bacterium]
GQTAMKDLIEQRNDQDFLRSLGVTMDAPAAEPPLRMETNDWERLARQLGRDLGASEAELRTVAIARDAFQLVYQQRDAEAIEAAKREQTAQSRASEWRMTALIEAAVIVIGAMGVILCR